MKKSIFLCTVALFAASLMFGQKVTTKDNFSGSSFDWQEQISKDKKRTVLMMNDKLVMTNKSDAPFQWTTCNFPIAIDENDKIVDFKISATFEMPDVSDDYHFGLIYGADRKYPKRIFNTYGVAAEMAIWGDYCNSKYDDLSIDPIKIVLKKGNKKDVQLTIEKKGRYIIFGQDNMEVCKEELEIESRMFGFYQMGKGTLVVKELILEQLDPNNN